MSIVVRLDDLLYARRMTLTQLSESVGITLTNLSKLKTGKVRAIRFSTLEALCAALQCQPGDLLSFANEREVERHPRPVSSAAAPALAKREQGDVLV